MPYTAKEVVSSLLASLGSEHTRCQELLDRCVAWPGLLHSQLPCNHVVPCCFSREPALVNSYPSLKPLALCSSYSVQFRLSKERLPPVMHLTCCQNFVAVGGNLDAVIYQVRSALS